MDTVSEDTMPVFVVENKRDELEEALDWLCKATGRDIFIIPPEDEDEAIKFLIDEIKKTVKRL